jgi:hypothetical protein
LAKVWVIETHTKGTGANMVPLERVLRKPGGDTVRRFVLPELKPRAPEEQEPRKARVFKVVDVMTRRVRGEGLDARAAVKVLEDVRSIVDVTVYVWEPNRERWRMLTFGEIKVLWEYRRPLEESPQGDRAGRSGPKL